MTVSRRPSEEDGNDGAQRDGAIKAVIAVQEHSECESRQAWLTAPYDRGWWLRSHCLQSEERSELAVAGCPANAQVEQLALRLGRGYGHDLLPVTTDDRHTPVCCWSLVV